MSFDGWSVRGIEKWEAKPWIENRHYAERMPSVQRAYGLFDPSGTIRGVCTFGPPPRMFNDGYGLFGGEIEVKTYELNRLVVDDLPENGLSWFVSRCLNSMPTPCAVISYADPDHGHHGYIYQATNWTYLGQTDPSKEQGRYFGPNGKEMHKRTVIGRYGTGKVSDLPDEVTVEDYQAKHRYLYLCGSGGERSWMERHLAYEERPYPKGDNERYDDSGTVAAQASMF